MPLEVRDRAVHDIPRHGHEIRAEAIHGIDDRIDIIPLDLRAHVDVTDLSDREALQCLRQIR